MGLWEVAPGLGFKKILGGGITIGGIVQVIIFTLDIMHRENCVNANNQPVK